MITDDELRGKSLEELQALLEETRKNRKQKPETRKTPVRKQKKEEAQVDLSFMDDLTLEDLLDD